MSFTRAQLAAFHGGTLPDLVPATLRLLIVGINPGLLTIATQIHFGRPGNRFYPALLAAGIIPRMPQVTDGVYADAPALLTEAGIGVTSIVAAASARADELTNDELREGGALLTEKVLRLKPTVVAIVGITAYRIAFALPKAATGRQPDGIAGSELWVVPNPSGLNAHDTVASLAAAYAEPARAAGIIP